MQKSTPDELNDGTERTQRARCADPWWHDRVQLASEMRGLLETIRDRLRGRDTALIAAGLTFYAGIAVVPALVLALALTSWLTSPETVRDLTDRLGEVLPDQLGAPDALARLAEAGTPPTPPPAGAAPPAVSPFRRG